MKVPAARLTLAVGPKSASGELLDGFSEEHRNKLVTAAKQHAEDQARQLIGNFESDVQSSARTTLQSISRAFGADHVEFEFPTSAEPELKIAYEEAAGA